MKIEIVKGDIATQSTDAIVNAANTHLWMGSGVAGAIKQLGGDEIEQEAIKMGPIEVGQAVATSAGILKAKYVIHAASMGLNLRTSIDLVAKATSSALCVADKLAIQSISFPAIGSGVGGLDLAKCARAMISEVLNFRMLNISLVRFVLLNDSFHSVFKSVYNKTLP